MYTIDLWPQRWPRHSSAGNGRCISILHAPGTGLQQSVLLRRCAYIKPYLMSIVNENLGRSMLRKRHNTTYRVFQQYMKPGGVHHFPCPNFLLNLQDPEKYDWDKNSCIFKHGMLGY